MYIEGDITENEAKIRYGVNSRLLKMPDGELRLHNASNLLWEYVDYLILTASFSLNDLVLLSHETALERNVDFDRAFYNTVGYLYLVMLEKQGKAPQKLIA